MTNTNEQEVVRVTLRDIYEKVEKQAKEFAVLNAKLDRMCEPLLGQVKDHETRIRTIERWVFALPGTAMVLSVAGLVIAVLKG